MKPINERAMLIDLSIGIWTGRRKDDSVNAEVTGRAHAEKDAGAWWTRIIPPSHIKPIESAANVVRGIYYKFTLPWADNGMRILPSDRFIEFTAEVRKAQADFEQAVNTFMDEYPSLCDAAAQRLGALYKSEMFPSVRRLRRGFYLQTNVLPIPTAADFRVDVDAEECKNIRRNIEDQVKAAMQNATNDLWVRMHSLVKKIADKLSDSEGVFRDSLLGNLRDFVKVMPSMNIVDDKDIEQMQGDINKMLAGVDADTMRSDKTKRSKTAEKAKAILEKISGYMPKDD